LEDEAFVGMGATILDGAVVEKGAMVAASNVEVVVKSCSEVVVS
jgi:carbonic anhydrase/acetyltransferase-like protein (isoleucine patch superfamily)